MKEIAIYGTGVWGNKMYNYLKQLGVNVSYFIKTTPNNTELFQNIPVLTAEEVFKQNKEIIIIIAIRDKQTVGEIYNRLLQIGFNERNIVNLDSTIKNVVLSNEVPQAKPGNKEGTKFCICCQNNVADFMPYERERSSIFENYHIIGGGYRENSICPICRAIDRNRWLKYVLENFTDIAKANCNVLHIAPERFIHKWKKQNVNCDYYLGDIALGKTDHRVDLTDIQFKDAFFDYIIANHVLEHIENIELAFSEIKRVLKPDGKLIISFPICMDIQTKEDKSITKPEDRLREFGQSDHVRLFGSDYKEYVEKYGFRIEVKSPKDCLPDDMIDKYGLIKDDIILICY